jgi:SOS-response transcriptional repressor LexA
MSNAALDEALLRAIREYQGAHGYSPTLREMARAIGRGTTATHTRLARLRREGLVEWSEGANRTLRVVGSVQKEGQA